MKTTKSILSVGSVILGLISFAVANETQDSKRVSSRINNTVVVHSDIDQYRTLIKAAIKQCDDIFSPNVTDRLDRELNRPIAFGGKSGHFPPNAADLEQGWEVVVEGSILRASVEYTEGDIDGGNAKQVTVGIRIDKKGESRPLVTLTVIGVGRPTSEIDLEKIKLNKDQMEAAGLK